MRGYETLFHRHAKQPDSHGGRLALSGSYCLQRRRHAAPRRHDAAALQGRGPPRPLAPVCGAVGQRRRRMGDRPGADAPARPGELSGGVVGDRGPADHVCRGARQVRDRIHGLQQGRARRRAGAHRGFSALRTLWPGHAARRQGRGAAAAAHRRELRAAAPPDDGLGRAHLDLVLAGSPQLGRPQAGACRHAGAPGGTRTRWGSRRR